jgi:hypothetical protein
VSVADRATLRAFRLKPGHNYGAGLRGDPRGYPQTLPPSGAVHYRIAVLGDSFAVGPNVAFADNALTRLQELLPHSRVMNFGVSGAGPRDYLAVFRRDVPRRPDDMVLVLFYVGNDITEWLPRPRYLDIRQNALYTFGLDWFEGLRGCDKSSDGLEPQRLTAFVPDEGWLREIQARQLQVCRVPEPPKMAEHWRRTEQLLQDLYDECEATEAVLFLACLPDRFQVDAATRKAACEVAGVSEGELDLDLPQRKLKAWCKRRVPFFDLRPALAGRAGVFAGFDTHWSAEGNRLVAEALAEWLEWGWRK